MPKVSNLRIVDKKGGEYVFEMYPAEAEFPAVAGVYVFIRRDDEKQHKLLYVGQTASFRDRPLGWGHEKWASATRMGLTHVCLLRKSRAFDRVLIQNQLIEDYYPPLNF